MGVHATASGSARPRVARAAHGGQATVEFALIIPVLILIFFALIDFSRIIYMNSVLSQAAREGARVAAVEAGWVGSTDASCGKVGGPVCPADESVLQAHITAAANRMTTPFGNVAHVYFSCDAVGSAPENDWTVTSCPGASRSHTLHAASVRVDMTFTALTPVIGQIIGPQTLSAASTMVIN